MGKISLNYSFHNPNSADDTTEMLLKFFVEANKVKVDEVIREAINDSERFVSRSA